MVHRVPDLDELFPRDHAQLRKGFPHGLGILSQFSRGVFAHRVAEPAIRGPAVKVNGDESRLDAVQNHGGETGGQGRGHAGSRLVCDGARELTGLAVHVEGAGPLVVDVDVNAGEDVADPVVLGRAEDAAVGVGGADAEEPEVL